MGIAHDPRVSVLWKWNLCSSYVHICFGSDLKCIASAHIICFPYQSSVLQRWTWNHVILIKLREVELKWTMVFICKFKTKFSNSSILSHIFCTLHSCTFVHWQWIDGSLYIWSFFTPCTALLRKLCTWNALKYSKIHTLVLPGFD